MHETAPAPQETPAEPKNENIAVRCTASEKRAVKFLALAMDTTESDLMRDWTMADIIAEAERRRARLAEPAA